MKEGIESEYLKYKLEPEAQQGNKEIDASFKLGLFGHVYNKPIDNFEFKKGKTKLVMQYSTPDVKEICLVALGNEAILKSYYSSNLKNLKTLDRLVIKNGSSEFDTENIFSDEPSSNKKCKIYFNETGSKESASCLDPENGIIFINGDPLTPYGLMELFHEIGHNKNWNKLDPDMKKAIVDASFRLDKDLETDESTAKVVLEEERLAWAFALNKLKHFATDLDIDLNKASQLVHQKFLKNYSDFIKVKLGKS